jgi:EamA domain-containing membrane protein RarD
MHRKDMGSSEILPDRSEIGDKSFSPTIDRFSLFVLSVLGILAYPEIQKGLETSMGAISGLVTVCGLVTVIPLIATSIGKMYVRIRS